MPLRLAGGKEQGMNGYGADRGKKQTIATALAAEYRAQERAQQRSDFQLAWHHLERAHILAQTSLIPHIVSHCRMLRLAVVQRDARETVGQIIRLALTPLGNLTGRLPIGNTGRSTVSAFAPMEVPPDLRTILNHEIG